MQSVESADTNLPRLGQSFVPEAGSFPRGVTDPLDERPLLAAALAAVAYYVGARVGLSLTYLPFPLAVLWPPNALLFGALLLVPRRRWPLIVAAVLPAHLLAELQTGLPAAMVLCWFVSNVSEAVVGATLVLALGVAPRGLRNLRAALVVCAAVAVAAVVSSFLDAAFVRWNGWGGDADYGTLVSTRSSSNTLAGLMLVPLIVSWAVSDPLRLRGGGALRKVEVAALCAGLAATSFFAFAAMPRAQALPGMVYLPVPFLVWAALRFGPPLATAGFAIVSFLVIWGAGHCHGPFSDRSHVLVMQVFLAAIALPLLSLAALVEQWRDAVRRLRASHELFANAFHAIPDAVAISRGVDGPVVEANERWREVVEGGSAQPGSPLLARFPSDRERLAALAREHAGLREIEITLRDASGGVRQALLSIAGADIRGEPCTVSIVRDISEQRRAEQLAREQGEQVAHLNRVATLTGFAGTFAHELNQPLTAILSNAQAGVRLMERTPLDVDELRAILLEIADADKRAGLLIQHLRSLMKPAEPALQRLDLNALALEVLSFVRGSFLGSAIESRTSLAKDLPEIEGDPVQLQQLLLNLVSNACDAVQSVDRGVRWVEVSTRVGDDRAVHLLVTDSGPGIPEASLEKIFEPFHTTKAAGLGLGLSICRRIAVAHGGYLYAERRPGEGATLHLVLPRSTV